VALETLESVILVHAGQDCRRNQKPKKSLKVASTDHRSVLYVAELASLAESMLDLNRSAKQSRLAAAAAAAAAFVVPRNTCVLSRLVGRRASSSEKENGKNVGRPKNVKVSI
jgi:hypothetical protein